MISNTNNNMATITTTTTTIFTTTTTTTTTTIFTTTTTTTIFTTTTTTTTTTIFTTTTTIFTTTTTTTTTIFTTTTTIFTTTTTTTTTTIITTTLLCIPDTVCNMGMVEQLVGLLHQEHKPFHEHLMKALLNLVTGHQRACRECCRDDIALEELLTQRLKLLEGESEFEVICKTFYSESVLRDHCHGRPPVLKGTFINVCGD